TEPKLRGRGQRNTPSPRQNPASRRRSDRPSFGVAVESRQVGTSLQLPEMPVGGDLHVFYANGNRPACFPKGPTTLEEFVEKLSGTAIRRARSFWSKTAPGVTDSL